MTRSDTGSSDTGNPATGSSVATVVLRLPASAVHVRTARLVAAAMARRSGVDESLLDEVRLAVGEACARAVRLHERYGVREPVTVEFADGERFSVAVVDAAPAQTGTGSNAGGAPLQPQSGNAAADRWAGEAAADPSDAGNLVQIRAAQEPAAGGAEDVVAPQRAVRTDADRSDSTWRWLDATADSLGLALLDAMVQDLAVTETGTGSSVAMSWPLER